MKRNKREERISADFLKDVIKEIKTKKKDDISDNFGDRYQLFRKRKKKYKRLKMNTVEPNYQWQIDLADFKNLQKYNSNIRYLLFIIDVYSRYVWVKKLRNKDSDSVLQKFEEIIEEEGVLPKKIHSDKGEFSLIRKKCKEGSFGEKIHYSSSENYEMKSVIVERFIRTLKMLISNVLYAIYGKIEGCYTNILDKIITRCNKTSHKGIDYHTPYDIYNNISNISKIYKYKRYFEFYPYYKKGQILKEGSRVRVAKLKSIFDKESKFNRSKEIFVVDRVKLTDPVTYVLKDYNGEILPGVFYSEELQKV